MLCAVSIHMSLVKSSVADISHQFEKMFISFYSSFIVIILYSFSMVFINVFDICYHVYECMTKMYWR